MGMFGAERNSLDKGLDAFARRNWREARARLIEASARYESAAADYRLGVILWRGLGGPSDREGAVACFRRAAAAGHASAQLALGVALREGEGAEANAEEARSLFRSAAAAGDLTAMMELAAMSDRAEARALLARAAELGHAPAMMRLADTLMYSEPVEALAWLYACAAFTASQDGAARARALAEEMSAREIAAGQRRGRDIIKDLEQNLGGR